MDTTQLIAALGGSDALSQRLRDRGAPYGPHATAKWRIRGLPDSFSLRVRLMALVHETAMSDEVRAAAMDKVREIAA